jgi:hypothetical protein
MAEKRPNPTPRPPKEGGIRKGGGGWQKPVKPPTQDNRPSGPPPKKP